MQRKAADILADVRRWARSRPDVRGVALVGSYASGKQRPDSDIDLVIIADNPETYRNGDWAGAAAGGRRVAGTREETFGDGWSLFVRLAEGPEIEFTFAGPAWANTAPPREEVRRIVQEGFMVLHDPLGELDALLIACGPNV
jgi:hypothetical protein